MRAPILAAVLTLAACGDDGTTPADGSAPCVTDSDCNDEVFCNGVERCDRTDPASDARGCLPGAPCTGLCDERVETCTEWDCPDRDRDGYADVSCGGDDCDDSDPDRNPGEPEICDTVDDDCDPLTLGSRDADEDGHVSNACCNGDRCGDDCDDANPGAHGDEAETCDGFDNDCDGMTDEGVLVESWPDADGDGYGDSSASPSLVCDRLSDAASRGGDCDDSDPDVSPRAANDPCDGSDDDCDGVVDEDGDTLCDAELGTGTVGRCVTVPDGGPTRCHGIDCNRRMAVCDGGIQNLCNTRVCGSRSHCGVCGNECSGSCTEGGCAGDSDATLAGTVLDVVSGGAVVEGSVAAQLTCGMVYWELEIGGDGSYSGSLERRDRYDIEAPGYVRATRTRVRNPTSASDELIRETDLVSILADPDVPTGWDRDLGIVLVSGGTYTPRLDAPHGAIIHVSDTGDAAPYSDQTGGFLIFLNVLPGTWRAGRTVDPLCGSGCETGLIVVGGATTSLRLPAGQCDDLNCA